MTSIKDRIVSTENVDQALAMRFLRCNESTLLGLDSALTLVICELIRWRVSLPNESNPLDVSRVNDAIELLETFHKAIEAAEEQKHQERCTRLDKEVTE